MGKTGYLYEEHETHLYYVPCEKQWKCWTNMQNISDKLKRFGWTLTDVGKVAGEEVDWTFVIGEKSAVRFFDMTRPKRVMTEEHLEKLRIGKEAKAVGHASEQFVDEES